MPAYRHETSWRPGLLLVNLGTPDEPSPGALRRYLAEFLADPRVVEIPRVLWRPILHGVVLRVRPRRSAAKYRAIWTPDGSPLLVNTRRQADLLRGYLGERLKKAGLPPDWIPIRVGMRYGRPSIAAALDELQAAGCDRLLVLPLYPQYAGSATGSASDAVFRKLATWRFVPALRTVTTFHDDPGYIAALAGRIGRFWEQSGRPDRLLMSFHGVPRYTLERGDPYHCFCRKTARLLAESIGLASDQYGVAFQSRFGRARWVEPYTAPTLVDWARSGIGRVDVVCPGFISDCLETLEEIAIEGKAAFLRAGGKSFRYIPCLNDDPEWMHALTDLAWRNLQGWLGAPSSDLEIQARQVRARALGATA